MTAPTVDNAATKGVVPARNKSPPSMVNDVGGNNNVSSTVTCTNNEGEILSGVPVLDLSNTPKPELIQQIARACETYGFFQVINHGISPQLVERFREQMALFFDLPQDVKDGLRRNESNARGYFDDELTKQRRDWKEAFDFGIPGSRDWSSTGLDSDVDDRNRDTSSKLEEDGCLDGYNQFPPQSSLPDFRNAMIQFFEACAALADDIAQLMTLGLGVELDVDETDDNDRLARSLHSSHTSYLRMNYYPPCPTPATNEKDDVKEEEEGGDTSDGGDDTGTPPPLGISPHTDAGFVTVLVQDDDCHSLQVAHYDSPQQRLQQQPTWVTVKPVKGAFTINTGDMAQIWSNGRYIAPLHRVLTSPSRKRYSAPFFYNPSYKSTIGPLRCLGEPRYHPCNWGYFRAVRFAGDLTDVGTEIQIAHYLKNKNGDDDGEEEQGEESSHHVRKQAAFLREADFTKPFSVERYRPLLEG